jgi:hypothetical protein
MLRGRGDRLRPGAQSTLDSRVDRAVRVRARIALPLGRATQAARHTSLAFSAQGRYDFARARVARDQDRAV